MDLLVRYSCVGGIAAVTDVSIFFLFAYVLGFSYLAVGACGFLIATYVNYALSIRFVFQSGSRFGKRHETLLVFLVSGIGLVLHQVTLYAGIELVVLPLMLAKLLASGIAFFWNFGARRYFVFSHQIANRDHRRTG